MTALVGFMRILSLWSFDVSDELTSTNEAALRFTAGYAFLTSITFSMVASAPTPIYRLYQETLGLTPLAITLIFAIYSLTMVAAFLTVARLSDFVGRKPMILAALLLNALALVLFIEANTRTVLMVARAVQGIATGIALATLGALITDVMKAAATLNSVTPLIGLMVGSLAAGSFVVYLPWPTQLVFALLLCVTLAEMMALHFVHETAQLKEGALAVFRPNLNDIPTAAVRPMLQLLPLTLSAWALGGFYLSLMPSLVVTATGVHSPLVGAAVVSALMLSGGISVLALRGLNAPIAVQTASLLLAIGIVLTMVAIYAGSPAGMVFGTIVAGVGFGSSYGAALRTLLPLAASHERAGLLSAYFVASYLFFALPAVGAGLAAPYYGLVKTALAYGAVLALCAVTTLIFQTASRR